MPHASSEQCRPLSILKESKVADRGESVSKPTEYSRIGLVYALRGIEKIFEAQGDNCFHDLTDVEYRPLKNWKIDAI